MNISVLKDEFSFDSFAAYRIVDQICRKANSVIGLSTGRTTGNIHRNVCKIYREVNMDVSQVTFFGLDEVTNVPREYSGACYTMLRNEIINELGIDDDHFLMLPTYSEDFNKECDKFRKELKKRGGIDLLILGLGENGHLGFNQPGSPLNGMATTATMDENLERRIRKETGTPDDVFLGGVTLGIRDIMHSRHIILVAKGENKRKIVKRMLTGPVTSECPASVLQLHPNCEFLFDTVSAQELELDKIRI